MDASGYANLISRGFQSLPVIVQRGLWFGWNLGSKAAARRFWPGEDPIRKRVKLDMDFRGKGVEFEVIGVAKTVRSANLSRLDPSYFYLPTGMTQLNGILIRMDGDSKML